MADIVFRDNTRGPASLCVGIAWEYPNLAEGGDDANPGDVLLIRRAIRHSGVKNPDQCIRFWQSGMITFHDEELALTVRQCLAIKRLILDQPKEYAKALALYRERLDEYGRLPF